MSSKRKLKYLYWEDRRIFRRRPEKTIIYYYPRGDRTVLKEKFGRFFQEEQEVRLSSMKQLRRVFIKKERSKYLLDQDLAENSQLNTFESKFQLRLWNPKQSGRFRPIFPLLEIFEFKFLGIHGFQVHSVFGNITGKIRGIFLANK